MPVKVGIPRAMLYHNYYPLWETFITALGAEVVLSCPTNSQIMNDGVKVTVDEACLPVKVFHGHVLSLRDKADILFLPRLVSVERKAFICPKLMGLPDMVRQSIDDLPPLIDACINLRKNEGNLRKAFWEIGSYLTANNRKIAAAFRLATDRQREYEARVRAGRLPPEVLAEMAGGERVSDPEERQLRIAVLGHPYIVYDACLNQRLLYKLAEAGAAVVTAEMVSDEVIRQEISRLPKDLFWTLGRRILGAAYHFLTRGNIDGIIHLAAFGCGPDSLVGELAEIQAKKQATVPFMLINLDEHTGEAGLETRLEAFLDMILLRRDAVESHVSPYGYAACPS